MRIGYSHKLIGCGTILNNLGYTFLKCDLSPKIYEQREASSRSTSREKEVYQTCQTYAGKGTVKNVKLDRDIECQRCKGSGQVLKSS